MFLSGLFAIARPNRFMIKSACFRVTIQHTPLFLHVGVAAVLESSRMEHTLRYCATRALP